MCTIHRNKAFAWPKCSNLGHRAWLGITDQMSSIEKVSGGSRRGSVGLTPPPTLWDFMYWVVKSNTLIEQSDRDSLIEQSHQDTLLYHSSFIIILCEKERKAWLGEREKRECKNWRLFFAVNFWLSLTSTLQQSRIPLSKILDPPLKV